MKKQKPQIIILLITSLLTNYTNAGIIGFSGLKEDHDPKKFQSFINYLNEFVSESHSVIFDTPDNLSARLLNGEIDIAILSSLNYIKIHTHPKVLIIS